MHGTRICERPRFFVRQLITPDDLTLRGRNTSATDAPPQPLSARMGWWCGHGWTFCNESPWLVVIRKGYILGPFGDEIVIEKDLCFDLRVTCSTPETSDPCGDSGLTSGVFPEQGKAGKWWVAVRYKEMPSRPVRVQPVGCGCDDTQCEYSRWLDATKSARWTTARTRMRIRRTWTRLESQGDFRLPCLSDGPVGGACGRAGG
jgi:hypothetical protein